MTRLCVAITASTAAAMIDEARRALAAGADLVELRLDFLRDEPIDVAGLVTAVGGPTLVTCRPRAEGGHSDADDATRMAILREAAAAGAQYIDCESATQPGNTKLPGADDGKCILSVHDFERTPADLADLFRRLAATPADVVKVAAKAETVVDALRMLSALRASAARKPTIALSMGEAGLMTRVLARKLGAELTFASLEAGRESAPGQPTLDELKGLYRWDSLDADTVLYGVIGCPVSHSMSPAIHNAGFDAVGVNAVYLPFRVEPGPAAFDAFVRGCIERPWLTLRGLSVTIPHKLSALRFAGDAIEPLARRIGAANTLVIDDAGAVRGYNTDYAAILDSLTTALGCERRDLRGLSVAVLGAGGAARAAVAGLTDCGGRVTLFNRTADKARALAADFDCDARDWADRTQHRAEIIINTTSVGMHPNLGDSPLPRAALAGDLTVFDTVYNPIETRLLAEARQAGCTVIDGVTMFVAQAAAQFKLFTGHDAPTDLMRQVVVQRLEA